MILHIYHCNLAIIKDYAGAHGQNRPMGTGKYPSKPGGADIRYIPPTGGFGDRNLAKLLAAFQSIDLADPDSPVRLNFVYLERHLGLSRRDLNSLLAKADSLGLLQRLTIDYDHERWLGHSKEKGCLVVMTGVEEEDLRRNKRTLMRSYCDVVDEVRHSVTNGSQRLRQVFVVPNGHLAPRSTAISDSNQIVELIKQIPPPLEERGYKVKVNSFGYPKLVQFAINAHKLGYLLRVI